jgi:hypothetical protein
MDAAAPVDSRSRRAWLLAWLGGFALLAPHAFRPPSTQDFWWLLAEGARLWDRGLGALQGPPPFVFTAPAGATMFDKEWLVALLLHLVRAAGGDPATVGLRALLVAAIVALFLRACRRLGAPPLASFLVLAIGATTVLVARLGLRPHLFGFALLLAVLERLARPDPPRWRDVGVTAALLWLWANVHGSFVTGIGLAAVPAAVAVVRRLLHGPDGGNALRRVALVAVAPVLACLNPNGLRIVTGLSTFATDVAVFDPLVMPEWAPFDASDARGVFLLASAGLAVLTLALAPRAKVAERLGWVAVACVPAAVSLRFVADAFLVAGPVLAANLAGLESPRARRLVLAGLGALAVLATAMMVPSLAAPGLRADPREVPEDVLSALDRDPAARWRVFTSTEDSGYLLARDGARVAVAYDARPFDPGFLGWSREFGAALRDPRAFDAYCDRHACDLVLVDLHDRAMAGVAARLASGAAWVPVAFDLRWALWARPDRIPAGTAPWRLLRPFFTFDGLSAAPADRPAIDAELERLDGLPGGPPAAAAFRGFLKLRDLGLLDRAGAPLPSAPGLEAAIALLREAEAAAPWHPGVQFCLGAALAAAGAPDAAEHLLAAARANPSWEAPRAALARLRAVTP